MKKKYVFGMTMAAVMSLSISITSFAAGWQQNSVGWWYGYGDGSRPTNTWQWIDGNGDGVAECYYVDERGYAFINTTTPDGYTVDGNGAWVIDGVVQTQNVNEYGGNSNWNEVNHSAGYDPAHPLKNVIDTWNLRIVDSKYLGGTNIINESFQALLTGQMDRYYMAPAGYSTNPKTGSQVYISQEDYDEDRMLENALYQWFCNWLNGMDFENMSEMERAREIQKVMAKIKFRSTAGKDGKTKYTYYDTLINQEGACAECALTACSLAKALGLKSAVNGTGDHAVYYIQADGKVYFGQNSELNLNTPTPDTVICR